MAAGLASRKNPAGAFIVSSLEGLAAELAEIDENFIRSDLSPVEYGEMLLRRKEIYETLHPETKRGGDRKSEEIKRTKCPFDPAKSFVDDTADKLGVNPRTVRRQIISFAARSVAASFCCSGFRLESFIAAFFDICGTERPGQGLQRHTGQLSGRI